MLKNAVYIYVQSLFYVMRANIHIQIASQPSQYLNSAAPFSWL